MNCERVQELVSEAIDGALAPADTRDFNAHLAACPPCRTVFGEVKESLALLGELPAVEVGADFDEAVWRRIRAEGRSAPVLGVRARLRAWREAVTAGGTMMRWAPLGAAAAVLSWVAVSSDPAQMAESALNAQASSGAQANSGAQASSGAQATRGQISSREISSIASASTAAEKLQRLATDDFTAGGEGMETGPEFMPVEYSAGMPKAVEQFLQSDERLNQNRYRQSSYHYPIRPVRDPLIVPVSTGVAPMAPPAPNSSSTSTESGVPVLAF